MKSGVFISHSTHDRTIAESICRRLEVTGIDCWICSRDIHGGEIYPFEIMAAIAASPLLVLVFSSAANASHFVHMEIERAVSRRLPVIPFRVEDVAPSGSLEFLLSSYQWIDATNEPKGPALDILAAEIAHRLSLPAPTVPPTRSDLLPPERRRPRIELSRLATAGLVAVGLTAAVMARVTPPWPKPLGIVSLSMMVSALAIAWASSSRPKVGPLVGLAGVSGVVYLILLGIFVREGAEPDPSYNFWNPIQRINAGFTYRPEVSLWLETHPGEMSEWELLRENGFYPENIWVRWTITVVGISLVVTWLVFAFTFVASAWAFQVRLSQRG